MASTLNAINAEDYSEMTTEDFDRILKELLEEHVAKHGISSLLAVGTVYNDLAEEWNNSVLDRWSESRA